MKRNNTKPRHLRGKILVGCICMLLGLMSVYFCGFFGIRLRFQNGSFQYPVTNCYMAAAGQNGTCYAIVNARSSILRLNQEGKITGVLESGSKLGGDTFSEASQICTDAAGNLYVADLEWSDTGFTVARERVLQYNASGIFQKELFCRDYGDTPAQKPHLTGLRASESGVCFLMLEEEKITAYAAAAGEAAKPFLTIPDAAVSSVQDAVLGTDGETVYLTEKAGRVCAVGADGSRTVLTDAHVLPSYTVPYHISGNASGHLFVTDLGNAAVYEIVPLQSINRIYQCEKGNAEILQQVSAAEDQILLTSNQMIYAIDPATGGAEVRVSAEDGCGYAGFWIILYGFQVLFLLIGAVMILALAVRLLQFLYQIGCFQRWKLSLIGTAGIFMTAILILPMVLSNFQNIYFGTYQDEVYLLADIAANAVDTEALSEIQTPMDYDTEAYQKVRQSVEAVIDRDVSYGDSAYLNLTRLQDDRAYAMFYLDDSIGAYYPLQDSERELLERVYETKECCCAEDATDVSGSYTYVVSPILAKNGTVIGAVEVGMDLNAMHSQMREIWIDAVISLVMLMIICIFLLNETVSFLQNRTEYQSDPAQKKMPLHELRLMTMLCFTALNMPSSFMPVYLESLHREGMLFSQTQCGTIPMTVNFALMAVMALFCAPIARRLSFRNTAAAGALICMTGDILMATEHFTTAFLGLILNGLGLGLILNVLTICVSGFRTEAEKNKGFAVTTSASLAGMLCGTVIGANLAKYVGQSHMFWFSAVFWLAELLVCWRLGRHFNSCITVPEQKTKTMHWFQFLRKPSVLLFILCVEFPASVLSCFCSYFVPLFAASIEMNEVRTSLIVVLNSLAGSAASVLLADSALRKLGRWASYLACAASASGILLFAWTQKLSTLVLAMVLFGIAESIGAPARSACYCVNPHSVQYGEDRAMGIYNFADNAGSSAGTSIFGALLGLGTSVGLSLITLSGAGLTGLYCFMFQRKRNRKKEEETC